MSEIHEVAKQMVALGKGILAADESNGSANVRLEGVKLEGTEENRRRYRDLLVSTKGIGEYMSGIILYDETMSQKANDGRLFLDILKEEGVLIGIKVDTGKDPDASSPNETITKGLDTLPDRLPTYYKMGARFAKWRAVIVIDKALPSQENVRHECIHLAQYARLCQDNGIVPMVEPEVLLKGNHTMERAADVTLATLMTLFNELEKAEVDLKALILKTSMVLPGKEDPGGKDSPSEVANETVGVLNVAVPQELAGVVFLSGGQLPIEATENLNEISKIETAWPTTFSYARAIQAPAMKIWKGDDNNLDAARTELLKRLKLNALASKGEYTSDME